MRILNENNVFDLNPLVHELLVLASRKRADSRIKDWISGKFAKWFVSPQGWAIDQNFTPHTYAQGEPQWANRSDIVDFTNLTSGQRNDINHMIDYLTTLDDHDLDKLYKVSPNEIPDRIEAWDRELANQKQNPQQQSVAGKDYTIIQKFDDGWYFAKLVSQQDYEREGAIMQHCVGGEGYYGNENIGIYSLRSPNNHPHVTLEVREYADVHDTFAVVQIKGKQNAPPVKKYIPYIKKFINDSNLEVWDEGDTIGMVHFDIASFDEEMQELDWDISNILKLFIGDMEDLCPRYYWPDDPKWLSLKDEVIRPLVTARLQYYSRKLETEHAIEDIDLSGCMLKSIPSFLEGVSCDKLDISNNNITSLARCPNVQGILDAGHNQNLQDISQIQAAKRIILNDCPSLDLKTIPPHLQCDDLELDRCNLTTLTPLKHIVCQTLSVSHNNLTSLVGAPNSLRYIQATNNRIANMSGLEDLTQINILKLSHNNLASVVGFPDNAYIQTLDISYNPITHLDAPITVDSFQAIETQLYSLANLHIRDTNEQSKAKSMPEGPRRFIVTDIPLKSLYGAPRLRGQFTYLFGPGFDSLTSYTRKWEQDNPQNESTTFDTLVSLYC